MLSWSTVSFADPDDGEGCWKVFVPSEEQQSPVEIAVTIAQRKIKEQEVEKKPPEQPPTPLASPNLSLTESQHPIPTFESMNALVIQKLFTLKKLIADQSPLSKKILFHPLDGVIPLDHHRSTLQKVDRLFARFNTIFFERNELLKVIKQALLSQGSVLILGPGGTGKSDIADRIGESIFDRPQDFNSYFTLQLTQDTSAAETHGGMIMSEAEQGRMLRNWKEGIFGSKIVFLDEFFDGRLKFLRTFLKAFNERVYSQGRHIIPGENRLMLAASNKYLNQIYETSGNNEPQAQIDRFSFVYYSPDILQQTSSILGLIKKRSSQEINKIYFDELDDLFALAQTIPISPLQVLRAHVIFKSMRKRLKEKEVVALDEYLKAINRRERVQPPYKTTRVFSPRSLRNALIKLIPVQALIRWFDEPTSELKVEAKDVDELLSQYLIMQGPAQNVLENLLQQKAQDPYEKSQLQTLSIEQQEMRTVLEDIHNQEQDAEKEWSDILSALVSEKKINTTDDDKNESPSIAKLNSEIKFIDFVIRLYSILSSSQLEEAETIEAQQIVALQTLQKIYQNPITAPILQRASE